MTKVKNILKDISEQLLKQICEDKKAVELLKKGGKIIVSTEEDDGGLTIKAKVINENEKENI